MFIQVQRDPIDNFSPAAAPIVYCQRLVEVARKVPRVSAGLNLFLTFQTEIMEHLETWHTGGSVEKMTESGRDMIQESFKPLFQSEKSVGAEGLHQALT